MENLVPLGTGNSRLMKSNIPASTTLAQLIQMLNNGTFPYDVGAINPAGVSQQGTPLNKATLLQDATAALYGLTSSAVPDNVLEILAAAALYKIDEPTTGLYTVNNDLIMSLPSVKIETGSYTGTGTYGSNNPNSLTFGFVPKIVFVQLSSENLGYTEWNVFINGNVASFSGSKFYSNLQTFTQNTVRWYNKFERGSAQGQLNTSGETYRYIAIG